jgi:hypothetical protein
MDVISVTPVVDIATGQPATQVIFGMQVEMDEVMRSRLIAMGQSVPSNRITSNILVLNFAFSGIVPYRIASKWKITVNEETGEFSVKEAVKQ